MTSALFWELSNDFAIAMIEESADYWFNHMVNLSDFDAMYCGF